MRRRGWAAIGLVTAALGAPPAHAAVDSVVGAGPEGTAHFAWPENLAADPQEDYFPVVHARRLTPAGTLSGIQPMSSATVPAYEQSVGVDAAGNAVYAWLKRDGASQVVQTRRRTPTGALSATQTLSPAGVWAFDLKMAVEPDGDAVLVWCRQLSGKYVIQARRRAADGTLGPTHTLSWTGTNSTDADVDVTPGGAATVAWGQKIGSPARTYVQTRTIAPDGTLSETQAVSPTTSTATPPRVAVSDAGVAVIAWVRSVDGLGPAIYRVRSAGGTLGPPVTFAENVAFNALTVAGNGAGRTAFAWLRNDGGVHDTKARVRAADGALGNVFDVGGSGTQGYQPAAAMDPAGNVTFAWSEQVGANRVNQLRRRTPAGTWGPLRTVSQATGEAGPPHLAVDDDGKATVAWFMDDGASLFMRTVSAGGTLSPAIQRVDG